VELAKPSPAGRLATPRLLAFALGKIPTYMLIGMLSAYLPQLYAGKMGVSLAVIGATIGLIRLTDLGVDLALGWLMDKTRTPKGRYRPWFMASLPLLWLSVYKVFNPPAVIEASYLFSWYLLLYVAFSMLTLSHSAWAAAISSSYNERSRVFGWMVGVGLFGSTLLQATPILTHGKVRPADPASLSTVGWIIIVVCTVAMLIVLLTTAEPAVPAAPAKRPTLKDHLAVIANPSMLRLAAADLFLTLGPGAGMPIFIFFFHQVKGFELGAVSLLLLPYGTSAVLGAPLWGRLAQRWSKHRTIQTAGACYLIAQAALFFVPVGRFWWMFINMFFIGFCASAFIVLILAMVADVADEIRLETGQERAGVLYALVTLIQKLGSSLAVVIIYPILGMIGFAATPGAVNTPAALHWLDVCYVFTPIALVIIGCAWFMGYKLDAKRHAEIRIALAALESRGG
jgi:glycoside/pentoside/hexuronide:cation symporter, GPH family